MNLETFRKQIKAEGLKARKQKDLEVFDVLNNGTELFTITYAELHHVINVKDLLVKKLRPEYKPPLG